MKILISGATGFIGKNLIKRLLKENNNIYAVIRPSTNLDLLEKKITPYIFNGDVNKMISFMQKKKFDGVIHLASTFLANHKPEEVKGLLESNVIFSTLLLEASVKSSVPWFINTGTFWQHYQNKKYSPVNLYAATKQSFEDIAKYYIETSPINFVTIKLSDTFGPNDTRSKIFNLWAKISKTKETLNMSKGEQIIDINYIDNVIDGYIQMIKLLSKDNKNKLRGKYFAIKSNKKITLRKLASVFESVANTKLNINWGEKDYRPREPMIPWEGGEKIPGWKPSVSLKEGIKKMLDK